MPQCLIALGSNLGDRHQLLTEAVQTLGARSDLTVLGRSRWRETVPIGGPRGQAPFLNGAAIVSTSLAPAALLAELRKIEATLGRAADERWASRPIDLDLLLYDELILESTELVLPHPRMSFRRFVLEPAADVAPQMIHPVIGWTVAKLLRHLQVATPYAAITGSGSAARAHLAAAAVLPQALRLIEPSREFGTELNGIELGRSLPRAIGMLEQRAGALSAASWQEPERWAVSDFWFDDAPAMASLWLSGAELDEFCKHWEVLRPTVMPPKLLVLLDADEAGSKQEVVHGFHQRLRESINVRIERSYRGPLLRLNAVELPAAVAELSAALEAMQ